LRVEISHLWPRLHRTRRGTLQSATLTLEVVRKMEEAAELAAVLHLLDRDLPPPRMQ
jgi:hypothetical protein